MSKKMMKRLICGVLAATSMAACVVTSTACETNNPKVELQLSFNGETYTLDYKLYRELAPTTVKHFLALAENEYYDGLCVHSYEESLKRLQTGAYSYTEAEDDADGLVYKNYYETVKGYENFPVSAWLDVEKTNPTYTLYGEFEDNNFKVESGSLRQTYGSLTMYYTNKTTDERVYVPYLKEEKKGEVARRDYKYNSATSMFYISLSNSSTRNNDYCTFAELEEESEDTLKAFEEALKEYIEANYGDGETDETFTTKYTVTVDEDDAFVGNQKNTATYYVPKKPIVIEKVTVKGY